MLTSVALCGQVRAEPIRAPLPNGMATELFAYLVLHRRRAVRQQALVDALWPDRAPRNPRAVVSSLLSRLRRSVGSDVLPVGAEVRLHLPEGTAIDVETAAAALAAGRVALDAGDAERCWQRASAAREIAGRGLLPGFEAPWIEPWRADVEGMHLDALELQARAGAALAPDDERAVAGERAARRAIARAPLRESAYAALMEVLVARGDAVAALQVYEQLRAHLAEELGMVPSARLRELHRRIVVGGEAAPRGAGASAGAPSLAAADAGAPARRGAPGGDETVVGDAPAPPSAGAASATRDRLDPRSRALVERIAALGDAAAVELLVRLDGGDRVELLELLQRLLDNGLVESVVSWNGPAVRFRDRVDEDEVLDDLPLIRRASIAADAVAVLEELDGDRVAIARLALRAVPVLPRDEAIRRAHVGVELLLRGRAFERAADLAERALAAGPARRDRVRLLLALGTALRRDHPERSRQLCASAFEAALELDAAGARGDTAGPTVAELLARAALGTGATGFGELAWHAEGVSDDALARRIRIALERLPADDPLRAQLEARLAVDRAWSAPAEARDLMRAACARPAPATATLRERARIELARFLVDSAPERAAQRLELAARLVAQARGEQDPVVEAAALTHRLPLLGELGHVAAVREDGTRLETLAEVLADPVYRRVAVAARLFAAFVAGSREEAARLARAAAPGELAATDELGLDWQRLRLRLADGEPERAVAGLDELVQQRPSFDGLRALAALGCALAGRLEEARRRAAAWRVDQLPEIGRGSGGELHAWSALALVAARTGDTDRAAVLRTLLEPFADRHAVAPWLSYLAPVHRPLGELARVLGDEAAAGAHFQAGAAAARALGAGELAAAIAAEAGPPAQRVRDRI